MLKFKAAFVIVLLLQLHGHLLAASGPYKLQAPTYSTTAHSIL
jgi:hypothetical protein